MANFVRNVRGNTNCGARRLRAESCIYHQRNWVSAIRGRLKIALLFFFFFSFPLLQETTFFLQVASGSYVHWWYALPRGPVQLVLGCEGTMKKLYRQHSNHLLTSLEKDTGCCLTIQMPLSQSVPNHRVAKGARPRRHTRWVSGFLLARLHPRTQWPNVETCNCNLPCLNRYLWKIDLLLQSVLNSNM